jgi:hypothetical protein
MIYLPYANFQHCADCFDTRTLKRQCIRIIRLLEHYRRQYPNRLCRDIGPCVADMWAKYQQALVQYGIILAAECLKRGVNNAFLIRVARYKDGTVAKMPKWLGWEPLHKSHRAALILLGEREVIKNGISQLITTQMSNRRRLESRQHRRGSVHETITVDEWLMSEYGVPLKELDYWGTESLKHRFVQDYHLPLLMNYYRLRGFTERANISLAWPNIYAESTDERVEGSDSQPTRNRARALPRSVCAPAVSNVVREIERDEPEPLPSMVRYGAEAFPDGLPTYRY